MQVTSHILIHSHLIAPAKNTLFRTYYTSALISQYILASIFIYITSLFSIKALQSQHMLHNSTTVIGHLKKKKKQLINLHIQTKLMYI